MESEHSMAREERDGSGTEMEFMAMPPAFLGELFSEMQMVRSLRDYR
jgi:hypothetical protein